MGQINWAVIYQSGIIRRDVGGVDESSSSLANNSTCPRQMAGPS